ncbi:MAG: hypothetical protein PHE15_02040 [Dehalococcoidales bacterium]|jgi:ABC-2 type transport system permease protein|nr:hypothetical protein [Dehalococcoidales bacterium]
MVIEVEHLVKSYGAMPIIQLIQFPMLFLSGIFFPIEIMPEWVDITVLGGWLVACMVLSVKLFYWE